MTSKIKVDNINKVSDDSNIIKKCGTTTTIGSGASNPIVVDGSAVTLGRCGGTVALASGATQTGFGRTGTVDWNTTPKTATFTAASGDGFFANTSGGAFTMNLPAGSAGAIVSVADYAATWQINALTVVPNGSDKIGGVNADVDLTTQGQSVTFVFVDSTQGWINTMDSTSNVRGADYTVASGGNSVTTCGDFKIHTFTGPGTFTVSDAGSEGVEYIVVGGGGTGTGGGGGGGGFRIASPSLAPATYPAKPLAAPANLSVAVQGYPITVGGGGAGSAQNSGSNSTFSTITSAGGGAGAIRCAGGVAGGSGGGAGQDHNNPGAAGNTPPVSPPQGNTGGSAPSGGFGAGGGGGGATSIGSNGSGPGNPSGGGNGGAGAGVPSAFGTTGHSSGGFYNYSGGGGGGPNTTGSATPGNGGVGGGGTSGGSNNTAGSAGTANTGGGGGAGEYCAAQAPNSAGGGSGIVIIRYRFQN
jgi:hypothetical protein